MEKYELTVSKKSEGMGCGKVIFWAVILMFALSYCAGK